MHSKYVVYLLCTYSNTSELLVFSSTGAPTFWIWGSPCHYPHQWSKLSLFGCMNLIQNLSHTLYSTCHALSLCDQYWHLLRVGCSSSRLVLVPPPLSLMMSPIPPDCPSGTSLYYSLAQLLIIIFYLFILWSENENTLQWSLKIWIRNNNFRFRKSIFGFIMGTS